jgi:hypothetical protein
MNSLISSGPRLKEILPSRAICASATARLVVQKIIPFAESIQLEELTSHIPKCFIALSPFPGTEVLCSEGGCRDGILWSNPTVTAEPHPVLFAGFVL